MSYNRKKIAICHPRLGRGGSEATVMWSIEALKENYDVSLVTSGELDIEKLNGFYGTSVRLGEIRLIPVPMPSFLERTSCGDALRGGFYQRFCQKINHDFDVLISAYNMCDFGVPAIHFLADFSWDEEIRRKLHAVPKGTRGIIHSSPIIRRLYLNVATKLSNPSGRNLFSGEDIIIANSQWTAAIIKDKFGAEIKFLYPPVNETFPAIPFDQKEDGFVCIGRISHEKRIDRVIEMLKLVRLREDKIHLHIIGNPDTDYGNYLINKYRGEESWISFEGECSGPRKHDLLSRHKFGIHGCSGEAFGIAVAEMVKAGCITWVPDDGGQTEIVDHPMLKYSSIDDAVDKIDRVLRQRKLQNELTQYLKLQALKFSEENFVNGLQKVVQSFLALKNNK